MWTEMTMVSLACDQPGCAAAVADEETGWRGCWTAKAYALEAARDQDWDVVDLGEPVYCQKHAKPQCIYCDRRDEHMVANAGDEPVCTECAKTEDLT